MPAHTCNFPTCSRAVSARGGYCRQHAADGKKIVAERQRFYDRHARDPVAKAFYNSARWKRARKTKLATHPVCERCTTAFAVHVHHVKPLKQCSEDEKTAQANLMALCVSCHNVVEAEAAALVDTSPTPYVAGMLRPVEDERFYYDAVAAEKPVTFIETYCRHYEDRFNGEPFLLLDWQKDLIRTLFGWKYKAGMRKGLRRFRELYLISAKGAGKTPMLAGIGLFMLLADGEAGAHVISMASTVEQAGYTYDAARNYINICPKLAEHPRIDAQEHKIKAPKRSKWTKISGEPNGRSGSRPSCVIADEVHEWSAKTAKGFRMVCKNLFKRQKSLVLMATNAGEDKTCYAWQVHERAQAILSGKSDDTTLLPCVFEAPRELDWRSEAAAKAANPSMGQIVQFEAIVPEQAKGEPEYRRLYLSQWVAGSLKWLDMDEYDRCVGPIPADALAGAPLYVGLDLSRGDDLCAAVFCYPTAVKFYLQAWFWMPRRTAEQYHDKNGIPYPAWGRAGDVEILEPATISTAVQEQIGAAIVRVHQAHPITAVCYDRAFSNNTIAVIESAGIECRQVGQKWGLREGTDEFERRITEKSLLIEPNAVMRYCAANAEVDSNDKGDRWPVKPMAKGRYAGYRPAKIDGITAAVTAMTEARTHSFPKSDAPKVWSGVIAFASTKGPK